MLGKVRKNQSNQEQIISQLLLIGYGNAERATSTGNFKLPNYQNL
jgi:hypothetical protein